MTGRISPRQFHEAGGVEDWRALFGGAQAHFRTGSYPAGVALVAAIGRLAAAADHHTDVDLRPESVTVRAGAQVRWQNFDDGTSHSLTSD